MIQFLDVLDKTDHWRGNFKAVLNPGFGWRGGWKNCKNDNLKKLQKKEILGW